MRSPSARRHFANSPPMLTGLVGLATLLLAFVFWPRGLAGTVAGEFHLFLLTIFAVMVVVDLGLFRTWAQAENGLGPAMAGPADRVPRLVRKGVGLAALAAALAVAYACLPLYQDPWYARFTGLLWSNLGVILGGALIYVVAVDRLQSRPRDGLHALGELILSRGAAGDRRLALDMMQSWLVKGFFLPLMYCYGLDDWTFFYTGRHVLADFGSFYEFAYRFLFFVDVCFAIIGYAVSSRLLGSHVRWPERSLRGWLICVMCYAPFWQVIGRSYLDYGDGITWGTLLGDWPLAHMLWGSAILVLLSVYVLATVSFGLRFSNLTYRGTVHRGPYALVRHPAYVSKNLTMWMIQLPFLAVSPVEALGNTLALIGINLIYLARARHEEACCRQSRDYRLYERYMRRFGPVRRILRRLAQGGVPVSDAGVAGATLRT